MTLHCAISDYRAHRKPRNLCTTRRLRQRVARTAEFAAGSHGTGFVRGPCRQAGPFGETQTPENGVCASPGTLTTGAFSGGHATITGITGAVNGTAIASLLSTNPGYAGNDNILFSPGTPYLDDFGVSFSLTGGDTVNMYYGNGVCNMYDSTSSIDSYEASFTLTPIAAPEPGTLSLLALGALGLLVLRKKRRVEAEREPAA